MGKIFGISDLPVSIPTTPFEPIVIPKNPSVKRTYVKPQADTFQPKNLQQVKGVDKCLKKVVSLLNKVGKR